MWGYMQQRATNDNAATVPAQVAATGLPELAGLAEHGAGFAQAVKKLRDTYAPNVLLAYHMSIWGTGHDIIYGTWTDAQVDALGVRSGNFYNSLGTNFDIAFADQRPRRRLQAGDRRQPERLVRRRRLRAHRPLLRRVLGVAQKRLVVWQIPYGNTKMRAMNNTWATTRTTTPSGCSTIRRART